MTPSKSVNKASKGKQLRDDWLKRLSDLFHSVEGWAKELGWSTRRIDQRMEDAQIGAYQAPALLLQNDTARVLLEPITRAAPGADGVVDLYLMPAYDDIASLYLVNGTWQLHYLPNQPSVATIGDGDSLPLSKETLAAVLERMKNNAV